VVACALREALHDGGLADTRLADEHGVVLGCAGLRICMTRSDLGAAADARGPVAVLGQLGEVARTADLGLTLALAAALLLPAAGGAAERGA